MNDQQRASRIALQEGREQSKRIRVGLSGLAAIVLIIGLMSAMMARLSQTATDQAVPQPQPKPAVAVPAPAAVAAPPKVQEQLVPMAELGVAPGAPTAEVGPSQ